MNQTQRKRLMLLANRVAQEACKQPGPKKIPVTALEISELGQCQQRIRWLDDEANMERNRFSKMFQEIYGIYRPYHIKEIPNFVLKHDEKEMKAWEDKKSKAIKALEEFEDNLIFNNSTEWKELLTAFEEKIKAL